MTKTDLAKAAVSIVVGSGTSRIVQQVIKNNTNPESVTDQVTMASGALVIGLAAADATKTYTDDKIDAVAAWWNANVKKNH